MCSFLQFPADLVTVTEEVPLCSANSTEKISGNTATVSSSFIFFNVSYCKDKSYVLAVSTLLSSYDGGFLDLGSSAMEFDSYRKLPLPLI